MNVTCLENKHKKIPPKQPQQKQTHLPIKKKKQLWNPTKLDQSKQIIFNQGIFTF